MNIESLPFFARILGYLIVIAVMEVVRVLFASRISDITNEFISTMKRNV